MPDRNSPPKYRHYRPKNLAVVRIDGRDIYLGKYGSPESWEKYGRVVAELRARGITRSSPSTADKPGPDETLTVNELILAYWRHVETYYRGPDGQPSHEQQNIKYALKPVRKLYGLTPAHSFGPLALRAVRAEMVRSGLARTTVNGRVHRVRRCFRWAASVEMVPGSLVHDLDTVESLARGRTTATEPDSIEPVPIACVEAVLPLLPKPVAAMVMVQVLTGCRVGDIIQMRGCDLTFSEPNWEYRPASHKNAWRGHSRIIPIGPRAQGLIRPFLKPDPNAYLFAARDAVEEHHARRGVARKSKPTPSELARRKGKPGEGHALRYDRRTYRQVIVRACDRAFPHPTLSKTKRKDLTVEQRAEFKAWKDEHRWFPLQLRHTAATMIRAKYGLEAASNVLGHSKPDTTLIYAQRDLAKAHAIAAEVG
jgi:integrase